MASEEYKPLPEGVIPYVLQVAGHKTTPESTCAMYRDPVQPIVYKWLREDARGQREMDFYDTVYAPKALDAYSRLRAFLPVYHGVYQCPTTGGRYIALSDQMAVFQRPNLCDVKLGTVNYRPDTSTTRQLHEQGKYQWQRTVGFIMSGVWIYNQKEDSFTKLHKQFCRSLTPEQLYTEGPDPSRCAHLAKAYLHQLNLIQQWFNEEGSSSMTFCRTSLLLGHEALHTAAAANPINDNNDQPLQNEGDHHMSTDQDYRVVVKLIDFADWAPSTRIDSSPNSSECDLTSGFAKGLSFLIGLMQRAMEPPVERNGWPCAFW